jgi:hypothetical protein
MTKLTIANKDYYLSIHGDSKWSTVGIYSKEYYRHLDVPGNSTTEELIALAEVTIKGEL